MPYSKVCFSMFALLSSFLYSHCVAAEKPNFVFIIADDCTFRDIGCYGGQAYTPNIDQLATEGIRLTRCFQAAPMCSPTRHNIYTGIYPVKSGAYPNHTFIKKNVKTVVQDLKPLGYRVALSGKQHINPSDKFQFEYSRIDNNPDMTVIEQLFDECNSSETPFCLFACSNEPHEPYTKGDTSRYPPENVKLPPYLLDTPATREHFSKYLAEITYYDQQVGQILDLLNKYQLSDNTMVMVVSEQGNAFPFAKWTLYDSGLQSIMVVRWPGNIKPNTKSDAMVEYIDILPTFLDAAGGNIRKVLEGKSMLPVLTGKTDHHKDFVYGIQTSRGINAGPKYYGRRSVRSENYKLIHNLTPEAEFTNVIVKDKYFQEWQQAAEAGNEKAKALVERYHSPPEFELFNIVQDPLELNNLADDPEHQQVLEDLKTELAAWMKQQGDQGQETEMAALKRMTKTSQLYKRLYPKNQGQKKKKRKQQDSSS
ncbi:Choline-sulfatase [Planctomycetales bacterium 10988]|nr:Choline-sulfatase [Planctomycetales bacterium 10988]